MNASQEDLAHWLFAKQMSKLADAGVRALSLDIFDTLLLRSFKSEKCRFLRIARLHRNYFKNIGLYFPVDALLYARIVTHKIGYATSPTLSGEEHEKEAGLSHLLTQYLIMLDIKPDDHLLSDLYSIELSFERQDLRINKSLCKLASQFREHVGKLYLISDMYLHKDHIERLFCNLGMELNYDEIYVSNDYMRSKRKGGLYKEFLDSENLCPSEVMHIGDNYHSDSYMASLFGINAVYKPRNIVYKAVSKLASYQCERRYRHIV